MRIAYFSHSLRSCWNHGNAHFLRGVLSSLARMGHDVIACERPHNWSHNHLREEGQVTDTRAPHHREVGLRLYDSLVEAEEIASQSDLCIVHEWNEPPLAAALGHARRTGGRFRLYFHDTHHRAISDPESISAFELDGYDGVLAFGETLADVYRQRGWGEDVFTWHEAADTALFHPPAQEHRRNGLVWIGNWGDGERSEELREFLLAPAQAAFLPLDVYGVRYPPEALAIMRNYGAQYRSWLPNVKTPEVFAQHLATVHVPRRLYVTHLKGIPTIRMFEALACGIPLVSAPWDDCEHLFRTGTDYLVARNGTEMARHLRAIAQDEGLRESLARSGLETIRARHTCARRAEELMRIVSLQDACV